MGLGRSCLKARTRATRERSQGAEADRETERQRRVEAAERRQLEAETRGGVSASRASQMRAAAAVAAVANGANNDSRNVAEQHNYLKLLQS
ncbi:hypothetical protein Esti_005822 [Eimeria stiedai]